MRMFIYTPPCIFTCDSLHEPTTFGPCLWLGKISIKRYRHDTMPKSSDTRKPCEVGVRVYNNLLQPPPYISFLGVVEDCCILSLRHRRVGLNKFFLFSSLLFYSFMLVLSTYYSFRYTYYSTGIINYSHIKDSLKNIY